MKRNRNRLFHACDLGRPHLATPFRAVVDGREYDAATNGHYLVLLPGPCEYLGRPDAPPVHKIVPTSEPAGELSTTWDKLFDWAFATERCLACTGSGDTEIMAIDASGEPWKARARCGHCRGSGFAKAPGKFDGSPALVDRRLLWAALLATPVGGDVWVQWSGELDPLLVRGESGWIVLIMPLRRDSVDEVLIERFEDGAGPYIGDRRVADIVRGPAPQ